MKTNFDFLDTGSFLYIFVAVAILAIVLWSFLQDALQPLLSFLLKPKPKDKRGRAAPAKANVSGRMEPNKPQPNVYKTERMTPEFNTQ